MKAVRFVIRSLGHGQPHIVGTIANAVRRYRVKRHDLWMRIQSTNGLQPEAAPLQAIQPGIGSGVRLLVLHGGQKE